MDSCYRVDYSCRMYHSKSTITLEGKKKLPNKYIDIDNYLWTNGNTDSEEDIYKEIKTRSAVIDDKNKKLDNYYNRITAWLAIGGILFILGFVFVNLVFAQNEQYIIQKETNTQTISSAEKIIGAVKIIQKDTLNSFQIQQSINTDNGK